MRKPEWSIPATVKALYTTRSGGASQAPFDSFNLAEHVGDDFDQVLRNREILLSQSLPSVPCWLQQT
ncbi:MAG: copper oxidase (laccase) domain-containing protein, partial [Flavobacteriales bacterium]